MYRHTKTGKTLLFLLSMLLLTAFLLAACTPDNGDFKYPQAPAQGEVVSNGGIAVMYGDYIYYVNSYVSDVSSANSFNGDVKSGDIVRIKKSDLDEITAINDEDLTSALKTERIAAAVYEKVEVVVPMFYYSGNTTDTSVTGLYIYGDKLYFTTPNTSLGTNGAALTDQLCVYRADLDGRNTARLYTFTKNSLVVSLMEKGGKVYAVYVETDTDIGAGLRCVDLSQADNESTLISKDVASVTFDLNTLSAYYLNADGAICSYTAGDAEEKVLLAEEENITYTIKSTNGGYVYYTQTDSTNTALKFGVLAVKAGMTEPVQVLSSETAASGTFFGYKEGVVWTGTTYDSTPTMYQVIITSGIAETYNYVLPKNTNNSAVTLNKIDGDTLYYTVNSILYSLDLSVVTETTTAADTVKELAYSVSSATGWGAYDILGDTGYVVSFSSNNTVVTQYKEVKGSKTNVTTIITSVVPEEDD